MEDDGDLVAGLDTIRTGVGDPSVGQATDVHCVVHRATPTTDFSTKSSPWLSLPETTVQVELSRDSRRLAPPRVSSLLDVEEPPPQRTDRERLPEMPHGSPPGRSQLKQDSHDLDERFSAL